MSIFKKDQLTERVPLNLTPQEKSVLDALAYWRRKTPIAMARQILRDGMEEMLQRKKDSEVDSEDRVNMAESYSDDPG